MTILVTIIWMQGLDSVARRKLITKLKLLVGLKNLEVMMEVSKRTLLVTKFTQSRNSANANSLNGMIS